MKVINSPNEMQAVCKKLKKRSTIGFVPTMGFLHEGHLSLVKKAKEENEIVVVSIFVNPAQFGKNEDFSTYPKNIEGDSALLEKAGVDLLFLPTADTIYTKDHGTWVEPPSSSNILCGKSRPGHFRGVLTVVLKLLNIVLPSKAYFGKKDYQQFILIRNMCADFNLDVEIIGLPIIRNGEGLALSSRNSYLSASQQKGAAILQRALKSVVSAYRTEKVTDPKVLLSYGKDILSADSSVEIDYLEIRHKDFLQNVEICNNESILLVAIKYDKKVRLIDNIEFDEVL